MSDNTVEVSGISFLEFSGGRPQLLTSLFDRMGMAFGGKHKERAIELYHHGDIRFISNPTNGGNAELFRLAHVRGVSAMGLKVRDAERAFERAIALGAKPAQITDYPIPAIKGVGASLIYLVDQALEDMLFKDFDFDKNRPQMNKAEDNQLVRIDHLTHNLHPGGVERMCRFYENIFGFVRVRSFDIEGKKTGLYSEVVASPCGNVIIPLNESKDDKSQIAEFTREYNGEGVQHIALASTDIFRTVNTLKHNGIEFQQTPSTYYEQVDDRLPDHPEDTKRLEEHQVLIDGGEAQGGGYLLQIFTKNSIGPIFFEYIQRKGNKGFGEGNFQALFESIELDQLRRGVI